jgi:alanine racemase
MQSETSTSSGRHTRAEIDLDALRENVRLLADSAGDAELWAVVKANAYGHGSVPCAKAALTAGASGLCVALTQEAVELRESGIEAPIMVLSEQPIGDIALLVRHGVICVAYNEHYITALDAESGRQGTRTLVHLKVDTGMHRVGVGPSDAQSRARTIAGLSHLTLDGLMTHLATADDPGHPATKRQIDEFRKVLHAVKSSAPHLRHVHVANSAATLRQLLPEATMVRVGISMYGLQAGDGVADLSSSLRAVMSLVTRASHVQRVRAGEGVSYGLRAVLEHDTNIVTLPLGYADGVARRSWATPARVLLGGKPRRIVGVVTMDQMMVDCGDDEIRIGDEAVIFGRQGNAVVRVEDWAAALDTITYEVVCAVSDRVPRVYHGA